VLFLESLDLRLHVAQFVEGTQDVSPVTVSDASCLPGTDRVEYPFGDVGVGAAVGTVPLKVSQQGRGVIPDVAKIDAFAGVGADGQSSQTSWR